MADEEFDRARAEIRDGLRRREPALVLSQPYRAR